MEQMKNQTGIRRIIFFTACALLMTQPHAYAQDAITQAQVEFEEGVGPTYPVNPEDPDTDGNGPGETGSFLIVDVSDFLFGSMKITPGTQWLDIETFQPNIQVVDLRGTNTGWRVSASVSTFLDKDNVPSLPGSVIHIYDGRSNSSSISAPPVQIKNVALSTDGEPYKLITAAQGAGSGLWVMRWYPATTAEGFFVQLEVPAGSATLGNHTAEIEWILENGPST